MNTVSGARHIIDAENRVKAATLGIGIGVGVAATTKEILERIGAAVTAQFTLNVTKFLLECQPLDNDHTRIICSANVPQPPAPGTDTTNNILTGVSGFLQVLMMSILIWSLIKTYKTEAVVQNDSIPASAPPPSETTVLLGDETSSSDSILASPPPPSKTTVLLDDE